MAANQANEHDSNDLYSEDFPELSSQGLLIHDFLEYTSEPSPNDTEPIEGAIQPAAPTRPPSPEVRISKEYQRIDYFQRVEYGQRMENFHRLESQIQYSCETAIERREQNFQKTAMDCLSGIQAHFVGPMGARDLLWLVQFPYLNLRYFQNERRVASLLSYMDSQVQRMAGSSTSVDSPYKSIQGLRRDLIETYQANYDAVLLPLFAYIENRLLQHIDLQDWTNGERLTLFDPTLVEIVIKPSEELYEKASELEHLEMCTASYRFGEVTRWTGFEVLDEDHSWQLNSRQFPIGGGSQWVSGIAIGDNSSENDNSEEDDDDEEREEGEHNEEDEKDEEDKENVQ